MTHLFQILIEVLDIRGTDRPMCWCLLVSGVKVCVKVEYSVLEVYRETVNNKPNPLEYYSPPWQSTQNLCKVALEYRMKLMKLFSEYQYVSTLPSWISTVCAFDRDRRCWAKFGCSVDSSGFVNASTSLQRLGKLKHTDSKFAVDPSSAHSIVIFLAKTLRDDRVCWSVR